MARVLVDTDVLAAHLRGELRYDPSGDEVHVSAVSRSELLGARGADSALIGRLLAALRSVDVDSAIADRAGTITRSTGTGLNDALIAATAIEHDLTLVTRNIWSFRGIDGLEAMAPSYG